MGTRPKVSRTWVAVVVSLAYGLLISSTAISRVDGSGFDSQAITLARVASLFEVFLFAWFFRHRMPSPKRLFAYGLACEIAYVVLYGMQAFEVTPAPGLTGLSAGQLTGLFCGLSEGAFLLLLCFLFSIQAPRYSAVSVAAGCVLFDGLTAVATAVPQNATPVVMFSCLAVGTVLLPLALKLALSCDGVLAEGKLIASGRSDGLAASHPVAPMQKIALLLCVAVFPFLYGMAIQVVNAAGLGTYNVVYQAAVLIVALALLAYAAFRGTAVESTTMLLLAAPAIFAAYAIAALLQADGLFGIGLLARVDYSVCQLVFLIIMARMAYASIGELCYYAAFFYGTLKLGALLGRFFASTFLPWPLEQDAYVALALVALGLVIGCCLCVALSARSSGTVTKEGDFSAAELFPETNGEEASTESGSKAERFAQMYGLSAREEEIFKGFARGFNLASIGDELGLSPSTVGTYMHRIYSKVGVEGRQGLAEAYDKFQ